MDILAAHPALKPLGLFGVPGLLLSVTQACDLSKTWRGAYLVAISALTYYGMRGLDMGDTTVNYVLGCMLAEQWLATFQLLFIVNPIQEWRHRSDVVHPMEYPLWYRIYWCMCMRGSMRGIGWTQQVRHVPPPPTSSQWGFVLTRLLRVLGSYLFIDAASIFTTYFPEVFSLSQTTSYNEKGLAFEVIILLGVAINAIAGISAFYNVFAVLAVATGLFGEPRDWPDCFGSIFDAYTVQRFWSITWHQLISRHVVGYGKGASKALGLERGSLASYLTLLIVGFFISGVLHCGGDAIFGLERLGNSLYIFCIQAVGMAVEASAIAILRGLGVKRGFYTTRVVGYIWVMLWFRSTAFTFIDTQIKSGNGSRPLVPVSIIRPVLERCGVSI